MPKFTLPKLTDSLISFRFAEKSALMGAVAALALLPLAAQAQSGDPSPSYQMLMQDILINADLWSEQAEILSANYGFEGITGVAGNQQAVIAAGGAWQDLPGIDNPPLRAQTSAATPQAIAFAYGYPVHKADALPVVFSWPVLPSTVRAEDFLIHLSDGSTVTAQVASIVPNQEYNERNTVVIFGEFGNRLAPGTEGALHPVSVEIAGNSTLQLVGRDGPVSAAGLSKASSNPYAENGGPSLLGAKLSRMSTAGEGAPALFSGQLPNDGVALYGDDAQFRLRILTSGGFSPDGVTSVMPDQFEKFFRIVVDDFGTPITLTLANHEYITSQGTITIVGLADLGPKQDEYGLDYIEDHDNQIDIILKGDEAAMRLITHIEIPTKAEEGYESFYNPGGPGMTPTDGVIYTQPGPYVLQSVTMAIDDPYTVTYQAIPEPSSVALVGVAALLALLGRNRFRQKRENDS